MGKCVCISCFDHYTARMQGIVNYYKRNGVDTTYVISDYHHYKKERFQVAYEDTIQLHVPVYKRNLSINRIVSHLVFSARVKAVLKKKKPDVIFCNFPPNSLVRTLAKYKAKNPCKLVLDCYDMWPESFPKGKHANLLKIPFSIWRNLRDKYINSADLVLVPSALAKKNLEASVTSAPIRVLYPALEKSVIPSYNSDLSSGLSFCYLGNINYITDIPLCVSLLSEIRKDKKVTLHHIGAGQYQQELVDKLNAVGVEVISYGVVYDIAKKNAVFSNCHMGLNIPREEIGSSMALKSVEYMRAGLPFINSGKGDNAMMVETYQLGINCNYKTVADVANYVLALTGDELVKMHNNCVECYEKLFVNQDLTMLD